MPSDDLNEQELQFKKRARRRLVGALALVLLMMIILPLVLDDRANKAPAQEISINIAGQDDPAPATNATTLDTDAEVKSAQGFNAKVVPIENAETVDLSTPEQAPAQADEEAEKPLAQAKNDEPKVAQTKPLAKQEVKSADHKNATPKNLEDKKATQSLEDKKISDKKTEKTADHEKMPRYMVQIGVFSDAANVKILEQKLSEVGYKSRTEKIQTDKGEKIRLSTGPFGSKTDAENALARMKQVGLAGMIRTI